MIFIRLNCAKRGVSARKVDQEVMTQLQEMGSQFDDNPIFVAWLTTALGFPTIAHILPCVSGSEW